MSKSPFRTTVCLLLSVMLGVPSLAISAGRGQWSGGGGGMGAASHASFGGPGRFGNQVGGMRGFGGGPAFHHGFRPQQSFHHAPFHQHPFFGNRFGRFFPFGAFVSPAFCGWPGCYGWSSYGWPYFAGSALYPDQANYYNGPAAYSPAVMQSPAPVSAAPTVYSINIYNAPPAAAQPVFQPAVYEPPAVSMPTAAPLGLQQAAPLGPLQAAPPLGPQQIVEYDGGRYELRGDGVATAYRWVWIPNPPPGPPGSSAMAAPTSELAPARRGTVYRWVDDGGVLHMTDRWQAVPQRYREQAKQNLPS